MAHTSVTNVGCACKVCVTCPPHRWEADPDLLDALMPVAAEIIGIESVMLPAPIEKAPEPPRRKRGRPRKH